jgi:DNA-binding CsgD family transcriptional regulator
MGEPASLRTHDYRALFRLVGECRDLGIDSTLWRRHMLTELARLTGAQVAMGGLARLSDGYLQPDPAPEVDLGWEGPRERNIFLQFLDDQMHMKDPALTSFGSQLARLRPPANKLTRCRSQLTCDRTWYNSPAFCEYHRPSGTDDGVMSVVLLNARQMHGIALFRPPGQGKFTTRDQQFLEVFHAELEPYLHADLAPPGCDPVSQLSPRLRDVLGCLLEGDSEQQVARRLGLTSRTVSQYVKGVYRAFGVNSRGELLARWIRVRRAWLDGRPPQGRPGPPPG